MIIGIKVITNAAKNEVIRQRADAFIVKVTVSPEKGKANKKVIELLAEHFGISKSGVEITRGSHSSKKTVVINK